jgi:hypothetical protein
MNRSIDNISVYQQYAEHIKQMRFHNEEAYYRYNRAFTYELDFIECPEIVDQNEYDAFQSHRIQRNFHQQEATKIKDNHLNPLRFQMKKYVEEINKAEDKQDKILIKKYTITRDKLSREEHKFDNAIRRACGEKVIPYNKSFYVDND